MRAHLPALTFATRFLRDATRVLRDAKWATRERLRGYLILLALANLAGLTLLASHIPSGVDANGEPLGSDFLSFWTAARMALQGEAAAVYDPARHLAAERAQCAGLVGWYAFFYPPMFLLAVLPLGFAPYLVALGVWLGSTYAAMAAALRALAPRFAHPLVLAAFPAVLANIGHGQNAFLATALFAGAAAQLERRPALAGALLGLLCFKPQLAFVAPLGLALTGRRRALAAFAATAAGFAALSALAFGPETWRAFLAEAPLARATLERGLVDPAKFQSAFAAARVLGFGVASAYTAQALAALLALAALTLALRREPDARRQMALIALATPLATPFLLDYDLTLSIVAVAIFAERGLLRGFAPYEKTSLIALYLLPLCARPLAQYAHLPISPPLLGFALAVALRRLPETGKRGISAASTETYSWRSMRSTINPFRRAPSSIR